jgi:hypothetical protein
VILSSPYSQIDTFSKVDARSIHQEYEHAILHVHIHVHVDAHAACLKPKMGSNTNPIQYHVIEHVMINLTLVV